MRWALSVAVRPMTLKETTEVELGDEEDIMGEADDADNVGVGGICEAALDVAAGAEDDGTGGGIFWAFWPMEGAGVEEVFGTPDPDGAAAAGDADDDELVGAISPVVFPVTANEESGAASPLERQ